MANHECIQLLYLINRDVMCQTNKIQVGLINERRQVWIISDHDSFLCIYYKIVFCLFLQCAS